MSEKPVLWHIAISHYNEKARWALDYKGVDAERRTPLPGAHMLVALWLTGGRAKTFPIIRVDGEVISDSTAIIAALEKRYPEPALYPEEPDERRRALEIEEFFDEEVAPHARLLAFHYVTRDPAILERFAVDTLPPGLRGSRTLRGAATRFFSAFAGLRYGVKSEQAAELARRKVLSGLDRLETELNGREYLVGDRFTVADLAAAALLYPVVMPPEGPSLPATPEAYERFLAPLRERPGYRWVEETFRRHRKSPAAVDQLAPSS